ncbi:hypothetical protein AALP_AAs63068U000100 [Arabis alpina]|uniref:Uncharacterized protein n=1 Tax=Arabis alpina TaxID=50452 RepID=A0A087FYB4_ARAAL|nr:hypothetical protein AALP_AAs63068U000100 [Arabis alpina]
MSVSSPSRFGPPSSLSPFGPQLSPSPFGPPPSLLPFGSQPSPSPFGPPLSPSPSPFGPRRSCRRRLVHVGVVVAVRSTTAVSDVNVCRRLRRRDCLRRQRPSPSLSSTSIAIAVSVVGTVFIVNFHRQNCLRRQRPSPSPSSTSVVGDCLRQNLCG